MTHPSVAVIIAAYNAGTTIGRAIRSARAEPEVAEIIVVDDHSSDDTVDCAKDSADGDPRVRVIAQPFNQGPSAARNRAIGVAVSQYLAILDSDDSFIPGRFAPILRHRDWDICADNILFARKQSTLERVQAELPPTDRRCTIDLTTFVEGNIGTRGEKRSELGFLKPVIRAAFLKEHGIEFDETCRLGEDFIFYTQCLAAGARFELLERSGYAALERDNSLSSDHSVSHLRALLRASQAIVETSDLTAEERSALIRHNRGVHHKILHRELLETKRYRGLGRALGSMIAHPTTLRDILFDRLAAHRSPAVQQRQLLSPDAFERLGR